jgi:glycosyltransferase involved in cell wall biosynthesis
MTIEPTEESSFFSTDRASFGEKTLVVIPAFNEEMNIASVVTGAKKYADDVLVVNDASTDRTVRMATQAGAMVVNHPFNLGYAAAVQTGCKFALSGGYGSVVILDGDGQHDPVDIPLLLGLLRDAGADMVIGSRFMGVGDYVMQPMRRLGRLFFRRLLKTFTGRDFTEVTSGFKAVSRYALQLMVSDLYPDEYPDADLLVLAMRHGCKIVETGVAMRHNDTGQSMHAGWIGPLYYFLRLSIGVLCAQFVKPLPLKRRIP